MTDKKKEETASAAAVTPQSLQIGSANSDYHPEAEQLVKNHRWWNRLKIALAIATLLFFLYIK